MTEQEKQAAIDWCNWRIESGKKSLLSDVTYNAAILALAALTAPPVKLPKPQRLDGNGDGYYFNMNDVFVVLDDSGVKYVVEEENSTNC